MSLVPNVKDEDYRAGATRGGRDRFKWDDVKSDRYRENYIGHSLKAPTNHWENKKDSLWWTKNDETTTSQSKSKKRKSHRSESKSKRTKKSSIEDEKQKMKQIERKMMAEALGSGYILRPEGSRLDFGENVQPSLDKSEFKSFIENTRVSRDEAVTGERISGLGMGKSNKHDFVDMKIRQNLPEVSISVSRSNTAIEQVEEVKEKKKKKKSDKKRLEKLMKETKRFTKNR